MAEPTHFANSKSLSFAAFALSLVACGSSGGSGTDSAPGAGGAFVPNIGAQAGWSAAGGAGPTATAGAGPVGGNASVPSGAGGSPAAPVGASGPPSSPGGGGAAPTPTGQGGAQVVPPASGGAGPGAAGSAGSGNGTMNGTVNGTASDTWTTASNLDANGLLIAPPADQGFQVATPVFELDPGQEVFKCYHTALPNNGEFDVGDWESQMSAGSHHFILYRTNTDFAASGTLDPVGCSINFGGGDWIYSAAVPHTHLAMPDGVAVALLSQQRVQFDMHYINTGTDPIQAHVTLNVIKVKGTQFQKAATQVSFNTLINIPPNGTQTVGGDCTPVSGAKYFMMLTHTHRRGVDATITRKLANGQLGEVLVHTTNWDSPANILWENPPYLTFQPGEKFHYQCAYKNDRTSNTVVGVSAADNEMCMAITYFFPATGSAPLGCTSDVE